MIIFYTNVYPTEKRPSEGTFIRNIAAMFDKTELSVLYKDKVGIIGYVNFYFEVVKSILTQPDDVHVFHFPTFTALPVPFMMLFLKRKVIYWYHGSDVFCRTSMSRLLFILSTFNLRSVNFVVPSQFLENALKSRLGEIKISVIPTSGVPDSVYQSREPRLDRLVIISRLIKEKGVLNFVKLYNESNLHEYYTLEIIGQGEDYASLKELEKVNSKILVVGGLSHNDALEHLRRSRVMIMPSLLPESLSLVVLEAMASGVLVVARRVGNIPYLIEDKINGYTFTSDSEAIAILRKIWSADTRELICRAAYCADAFRQSKVKEITRSYFEGF